VSSSEPGRSACARARSDGRRRVLLCAFLPIFRIRFRDTLANRVSRDCSVSLISIAASRASTSTAGAAIFSSLARRAGLPVVVRIGRVAIVSAFSVRRLPCRCRNLAIGLGFSGSLRHDSDSRWFEHRIFARVRSARSIQLRRVSLQDLTRLRQLRRHQPLLAGAPQVLSDLYIQLHRLLCVLSLYYCRPLSLSVLSASSP